MVKKAAAAAVAPVTVKMEGTEMMEARARTMAAPVAIIMMKAAAKAMADLVETMPVDKMGLHTAVAAVA